MFELWIRIISAHALLCVLTVACHIFIRVDATNEAAYELITEPIQEPQAGEQQEGAGEPPCEEVADPADCKASPGA